MIASRAVCTQAPQGAISIDWSHPLAAVVRTAIVAYPGGFRVLTRAGESRRAFGTPAVTKSGVATHFDGTAYLDIAADLPKTLCHGLVAVFRSSAVSTQTLLSFGGSRVSLARNYGKWRLACDGSRGLAGSVEGVAGETTIFGGVQDGVSAAFAKNGTVVDINADSSSAIPNILRLGSDGWGSNKFSGDVNLVLVLATGDTAALSRLTANPWQVFVPSVRPVFSAVQPTAMALAGLAQAVASASGALAVGVRMSGVATSVATANGALSTRIAVSGAAAAIASAAGKLTLGVVLSGAAIAKSLAAGALGTRFALGGTAAAHAGASGSLAVSSPAALAGDAAAHAAAIGTLTVQFALSGAAVAKAASSGTLAVGGTSALAGTAQATPAASGALSVAVPLAGNAQVVAGVTGDLTTGAALSGSAVAAAAASGQLMVTVKLSGTAVAQAIASGGLSLRIPLSAAAIAHANANGVLSGGLSPYTSDTRFTVRARPRNFTVTHAH